MRRSLSAAICSLAISALGFQSFAASKKTSEHGAAKETPQQMEEFTRLQIFLDNANFGPGKIDGHDGTFTRKALALYRQSQGQPAAPEADAKSKTPPDTSGLDLQSIQPVFIDYTITEQDAAAVGELPEGPEAQSKVKSLPYGSLAEAIAEKFHCDLDFLKQLNKGEAEKMKPGQTVKVPNVKPFELAAVKSLKPGVEAEALVANELGENGDAAAGGDNAAPQASADSSPKKQDKGSDSAKSEKENSKSAKNKEKDTEDSNSNAVASTVSVRVSTKESMLEVHAGDKIVAAFPVTVGSSQTASPIGDWKVRAIAKLPNFRYDKKMLNEGERSSDFKMLPPGPNNPVGIMWIALNKKGIGLHGTNDPDSIGRSASHGCIRLANWDVVKVAELVKPGVPVHIE